MSKWPQHSLGTVIELAYGKSLPKTKRSDGGDVPVYGSNGIAGWHNESLLDGPTVIVGRKGSAGAVQFVDGPCYPIDTTYFVRPRGGFDFDIKFLFYMLRRLDLSRLKTATGVPGLTREDAYREMIPVPPLSEQRRIVDLLSRAEGIVRLRREAEKKAAELIPALFLDMFGDPATNPKGWVTSTLGEVAFVQGGLQVTTARADLPLERPYLRVANVHRSRLELGEIKNIRLTQAEFERTRLSPGDLLVVEGHGNVDEIGRVAIWDGSINNCVHQNHLIRARLNPDALLPSYACEFLNSQNGRQFLLRSGKTTSGLNTISVSNVKAATILLPVVSLQREFSTRVESVRSIQSQQSAATAKAKATFDALLAQAFSAS